MKYGVLVNGVFEEREVVDIHATGFSLPLKGRVGTYDEYVMKEIQRSYGQLNVRGKIVLDVGANIGTFTCWAEDHDAALVVAIEPEPNNFAMLELNTQEAENIHCYNVALTTDAEVPGKLWLSTTGKNPGNSSTTRRRGRIGIDIVNMSVDALKEEWPTIEVAKIDCEGAEYDFMKELIKAYPMLEEVAMEMHLSGFDINLAFELDLFMLDKGFRHVREPKIQDNLWQTLAHYRRQV
jgi:FkbM family methyltransferase